MGFRGKITTKNVHRFHCDSRYPSILMPCSGAIWGLGIEGDKMIGKQTHGFPAPPFLRPVNTRQKLHFIL